jgi:hypothetical protein
MDEAGDKAITPRQHTARGPTRRNAMMPPEPQTIRMQLTALILSCDYLISLSTMKSQLRESYQFLASAVGEKEAQQLWKDAARRPRHRPPLRHHALVPSEPETIQAQSTVQLLSCERIRAYLLPAVQLRLSYELLAFTMGEEEAQRLWKDAAKRPRHRPPGSSHPEQDKELLLLINDAINGPIRVPIWQIARSIHDALPREFGPSAKSIEMRIRRLKSGSSNQGS